MSLYLFNTLSGKKEEFEPAAAHPKEVTLYSCGPTVYLYPHIGNMRSYVLSDLLKRTLRELHGLTVKQVINITDIGHLVGDADDGEDKVAKTAREQGKTAREIADFYTAAFMKDIAAMNVDTVDTTFPRASEYISQQIDLIKKLEADGHTYLTSDGVYFDTATFPAYGKLGNIDLAGLREGARIGVNAEKRNLTDFALWKFSPKAAGTATTAGKREQEWESPWGIGFPGWHIECSAMSLSLLGSPVDIHTGGIDHIPVHHNNEIAQSECATHSAPFVRYWLHNAFITVDSSKMSKSLGNIYTLADLRERHIPALAYRYWLLTASYRTAANFTWESVEAAHTALSKLYRTYAEWQSENATAAKDIRNENESTGASYLSKFAEAMNNDLNSPAALDIVWRMVKDETLPAQTKITLMNQFDAVLGLSIQKESAAFASLGADHIPAHINALVEARNAAKAAKDWAKADALRNEILAAGYDITDTAHGIKLMRSHEKL